jgi:hypothetical protein
MVLAAVLLCFFTASSSTIVNAGPSLTKRIETPSGCVNNVASHCYPANFSGIPINLIQCINTKCFCTDCFTLNATSGKCSLTIPSPTDCYYFDAHTASCIDNRKSQTTAFVLSLLLSDVGAANFYIGRNGLGAGQLTILLSTFLITIGIFISALCMCCCANSEQVM